MRREQRYLSEVSRVETLGAFSGLRVHAPQLQTPHERLETLLERVDEVVRLR